MNVSPTAALWISVSVTLAVEVSVLALLLALCQQFSGSARWRRTFAQAAILTAMLLIFGELSGAGRLLAAYFRATLGGGAESVRPAHAAAQSAPYPEPAKSAIGSPVVTSSFRERVAARLTADQPRTNLDPPSRHTPSMPDPKSADVRTPSDPGIPPDSVPILGAGLVWALGSTLVIARAALARLLLGILRLQSSRVLDPQLSGRLEPLARRLGVRRKVRVIESKRLACPIAFGWLQPTIGVPQGFTTRFAAARQETVLLHELAHLAGHDPFWCALADLATSLLWWHPAAWWLRRRLHIAGELVADEASLLVAGGPKVLAECLLEAGTRLLRVPQLSSLQMAGFRSHLGSRVERLLRLQNGGTPPRRIPVALMKFCSPFALTLTLVFCTAWATPRQFLKGDHMLNLKQSWKQSFAALALLAATEAPGPSAVSPPNSPSLHNAAPWDFSMANRLLAAATPSPTESAPSQQNSAPASGEPAPPPKPTPAARPEVSDELYRRYGLKPPAPAPAADPTQEAFMRRYGLRPDSSVPTEKTVSRLEAKLRQIVLPSLSFDGMPLTEVLKYLDDQSRKLDPDKTGVNFLVNRNFPSSAFSPRLDPNTGLPTPAAPEPIEMASVSISIPMPLRNISLKDALDAITKVADHPIEYSIEEYAVVFSPKPEAQAEGAFARREPTPPQLAVRTFKVDTNTFVAGLESTFGIKFDVPAPARTADRSRKLQAALKGLLTELGITMDNSKTVFYNELTGVIMVRATPEELEVVRAAIETLGGAEYGMYAQGGLGGASGLPALPPPKPAQP